MALLVVGIMSGCTEETVSEPTKDIAPSATVSTTPEPSKPAPSTPTKPAEPAKPNLELLNSTTQKDDYSTYIVGTIRNNSDKEYSYVGVEINLYDKDGAQVGSTLANTTNLEAGGKWKFKAVVLEDGVKSFKIKDISGF